MTIDQVLKHFRTQQAVANALGVTQPSISMWKARGRVPPLQQLRIQKITRGRLKADESIITSA